MFNDSKTKAGKTWLEAHLNDKDFGYGIMRWLVFAAHIETINKRFSNLLGFDVTTLNNIVKSEDYVDSCKDIFKKAYLKKLAKQLKTFEIIAFNAVSPSGILPISFLDKVQIEAITKTQSAVIPALHPRTEVLVHAKCQHFFSFRFNELTPNKEAVQSLINDIFSIDSFGNPKKAELSIGGFL